MAKFGAVARIVGQHLLPLNWMGFSFCWMMYANFTFSCFCICKYSCLFATTWILVCHQPLSLTLHHIQDLISRTLGPEFGGSIGILFCLSQAMTAAMNIIGFVEAMISITQLHLYRSHQDTGNRDPQTQNTSTSVIRYFLKTAALLGATFACIILGKRKIFCSMTRSVSLLLLFTLLSMLFSFINKSPFSDPVQHLNYTSFSIATFKKNLYPDFQFLDDGSMTKIQVKFSDYQRVFGIIFPSLSGILAGSSLSGELGKPSKSLPTGMISALISIIIVYLVTLVCLSLTCAREAFTVPNQLGFLNLIVLQISSYPALMSLGLLLCTLFSSIMGITVCGKILQAVSRDGQSVPLQSIKLAQKFPVMQNSQPANLTSPHV
jgi:potassium/chloride transporter 9